MSGCAWCDGPIPSSARSDSIYCSKRCRQAGHRFRRQFPGPLPTAEQPLRLAYADPPYPGLSKRHYGDHADYAGEVDHVELVERLTSSGYDGWALSTSARSLRDVWALCPEGTWLAPWTRGARHVKSKRPNNAWEPVLVWGGRQDVARSALSPSHREDALVYGARPRRTDPYRVTGAKPAEFLWWLFELLGALPGDELEDLYPGSGGVSRAWRILTHGRPLPGVAREQLAIVPGGSFALPSRSRRDLSLAVDERDT